MPPSDKPNSGDDKKERQRFRKSASVGKTLPITDQFPIMLRYHWFPAGLCGFVFLLSLSCAAWLSYQAVVSLPGAIREVGWVGTLYALPFAIIGLAVIGTCYVGTRMYGYMLLDFWRGRQKFLSLYPDGLTFEDTGRLIEVSWADIEEIYFERKQRLRKGGGRMVFVTRRGDFEMNLGLCVFRKYSDFQKHLNLHAAEAFRRGEERYPLVSEELDSKATTAPGEQVFTYKTRSNRISVWMPAAMGINLVCLPTLQDAIYASFGLMPPPHPVGIIVVGLVFTGIGGLSWLSYRRGKIVVTRAGITQISAFRARTLRWQEVVSCRKELGDYCVTGATTQITFSASITRLSKLLEEIALQIPKSVEPFPE